ncbi:hypothetical protein ACLIMP_01535 [Novosphingobium aerophilum]|uniref:hypothetical protein n=1 Tax=Novosphingobium aerophilum TaxID=2839843 RepID=UPI003FCFC935
MKKTGTTLLAALALGALIPASGAMAQQPAPHPTAHPTKAAVVKKTTTRQTTVKKTTHKKVTCRYVMQHGKKVKVCK